MGTSNELQAKDERTEHRNARLLRTRSAVACWLAQSSGRAPGLLRADCRLVLRRSGDFFLFCGCQRWSEWSVWHRRAVELDSRLARAGHARGLARGLLSRSLQPRARGRLGALHRSRYALALARSMQQERGRRGWRAREEV